jgi:prepilin peptidase CpaA
LTLSIALISLAVVLYALVAIGDLRFRKIPNALVVGVLILGLAKVLLFESGTDWLFDAAAALVAFAIVFPLFVFGVLGGGDVKLIPASVLLVGYHDAISFVIDMSLLGGVLSLIVIVVEMAKSRRGWRLLGEEDRPTVPYGVAIAGAAVAAMVQLP